MRNEEIDFRLKLFASEIPKLAEKRYSGKAAFEGDNKFAPTAVSIELELLNTNLMAVWFALGEIAKRLPEPKTHDEFGRPVT